MSQTGVSLRLLFVEDVAADAELAERALRKEGVTFCGARVETEVDFLKALGEFRPHAVISDYAMPRFDGMRALALTREHDASLPFIVLTGSMNEETAVECMKAGAADYVLKENVTRLPFALLAALEHREISLKKAEAEAALKAAQDRYRSITHSAPDAIITGGSDGNIRDWNQGAERMFGYSAAEVCGRSIAPLMPERYRDRHAEGMERVNAGGVPHLMGTVVEFVGLRRDGSEFPLELSIAGWDSPDGRFCSAIVRDISERRRAELELREAEAQLRQSQKMEAVGRLAGGVAHDFNNLLSVILGYGELLLNDIPADDPHRDDLEQMHKAAIRAKTLTRQLLAFGRRQTLDIKVVDINSVIRDVERLLRRTIGEDVALNLALSDREAHVRIDAGQIEQVLVNLAVNAREAMPNGGRLSVETAAVELDETYTAAKPGMVPGAHVMIAVNDSGVGMDKDTLEHIFEPFFTTRPPGEGSGLGLSTVYGIVKQHGGSIWAYSEPQRGSTFKIYLPVSADAPSVQQRPDTDTHAGSGSATVLVAEDEPAVRRLACRILANQGYDVLESTDASHAVALAQAHAGPIDLVLTDVMMPLMKGTEVYRRVRAVHPEAKVLYVSGYTERVIAERGSLAEGENFLEKPFTIDGLVSKIEEILAPGPTREDSGC